MCPHVRSGTEILPALRSANGGLGEESRAHREQPTPKSEREQSTGVLRKAVPRDPQAERDAGAHADVSKSERSLEHQMLQHVFSKGRADSVCVYSRVAQRGGGLASAARSEHEVSEIIDGISEQEVRQFL